jgi:hypothetical protein
LKHYADAEFTFKGFTGECARTGETMMSQARRCGAMFVKDRAAGNGSGGAGGGAIAGVPPSGARPRPGAGGSGGGAGAGSTSGRPEDPIFTRDPSHPPAPEPGNDGKGGKEAPVPPSPEGIAKDDIQKLLEAYRKAYEARDVERIKGVYPTAPAKNLTYFFGQVKSLEYKYTTPPDFVDLNPALGTATVKMNALVTTENKGPKSDPMKLKNLFTLKRQQGIWSIAQLDVTPDK